MPSFFSRKKENTPGESSAGGASSQDSDSRVKNTKEKSGLFCLNPSLSSDQTDVDIIAVHGLLGDWKDTWTDKESGKLWLRDFIPSTIPNARVSSYGYDSAIVFSKSVNEIDIEARSLLDRIQGAREDAGLTEKPVILIAHSLGGIIVKKALVLAHEMSDLYGSLLTRVHSILFFGVPHGGSNVAVWATFAARLIALTPASVNKRFLSALQTNSSIFQEISRQFVRRGSGLIIRTFFETNKLGGQLVVSRESATLNLPNELALPIAEADHQSLCRFSDIDSQKYSPVRRAIRNMVDSARTASASPDAATSLSASPSEQPANSPPSGSGDNESRESNTPSEKIPTIFSLVREGNPQTVRQFLHYSDRGQVNSLIDPLGLSATPLHVAAEIGNAEIVRILLESGADQTAITQDGSTPLNIAIQRNHLAVVEELLRRDEAGNLLHPPGQSIDHASSINRGSPLLLAVLNGHMRIVQLLLDAGANPNATGINGTSGLHTAGQLKHDEIVSALLNAGADPSKVNPQGISPLHAVNTARSAEAMIRAGGDLAAKIRSPNPYGLTVGATPLRVSVDSGNVAVVKVFADHSTREQLHLLAADGKSVLDAACDPIKPEILQILFKALETLESGPGDVS